MNADGRVESPQSPFPDERRYRSLVERMHVVTWEGDPATMRFTYVSEYAERLLGYPREAWYEPNFWIERLHPEDREATVEYCRSTTAAGKDHRFDYRMLHADGSIVWIDDVVQVTTDADRIVGVCGLMIDITERKKLEEQFHYAQKMEAVGQLAGGVAHDFNNLLTVITGYSHLLLTQLAEDDPNREAIAAVYDAGERAAALTRQLLTFSRRTAWQPTTMDLNEVVGETENLLRRLLSPEIEFEVRRAAGRASIRADRSQIGQVVMNLTMNARDAMPQGGRLTLTVDLHTHDGADDRFPDLRSGVYARMVVADTGGGMADEIKARAFEPFFTTKDIGKGTGLGLAVVHGIVKQCGGHIDVASGIGVGTTITILLPIVASDSSIDGSGRI